MTAATMSASTQAQGDDNQSVSSSLGRHNTPPFWSKARQRAASNISYQSVQHQRKRKPITLEDNTEESTESTKAVWAKQVTIDEHTIISGNSVGAGAYVVWSCTVEMLDGGQLKLRKRYSEFDELRQRLAKTFPDSARVMPPLPPKSFVSRFRTKFLEKRRQGLAYFLNCILLNPEFAGSPVLKDFVFS